MTSATVTRFYLIIGGYLFLLLLNAALSAYQIAVVSRARRPAASPLRGHARRADSARVGPADGVVHMADVARPVAGVPNGAHRGRCDRRAVCAAAPRGAL